MSWKSHPVYPKSVPFSIETSKYLKYKVSQKREAYKGINVKVHRGFKKIKLKVRATYAKLFFPKDYFLIIYKVSKRTIKRCFLQIRITTFKRKMWAKKTWFYILQITSVWNK